MSGVPDEPPRCACGLPASIGDLCGECYICPPCPHPSIQTNAELNELPDGSVIWYWVTYDSVEIHQQLMKHGDWWRNANDPDDNHEYAPNADRLSITLLRRGWPTRGLRS